MTALLDSIKYAEHKWKICGDLKVITVLLGMQLGYIKYCCFLCVWDSRDRKPHYIQADWPARNLDSAEENVVAEPLIDPKDVLLPPLHIKLGLMKNVVKGMNEEGQAFKHLREKFPRLRDAKVKEVSPLVLTGPSVHATSLGSNALVPCKFTVDNPPVDLTHLMIFWLFQDKEILSYNETVRRTSSRYSLSTEALSTGIANLTVSNIQIPDGGMYKCSVIYKSDRKEKTVRLDIEDLKLIAKIMAEELAIVMPRLISPVQVGFVNRRSDVTNIHKILAIHNNFKLRPESHMSPVTITGTTVVLNEESILRCSVTGFYPVDISIKWFRGREMLRDVTVDEPRRNSDGRYSVDSTATITPTEEDREQNFSCRVQHESLKKPLQEEFRLITEVESSAGTIAACIIVPILIILIAALWWKLKRRRKANGPFTMRNIEGPPKLIDGEEATLYCTVDHCPEELSVTWLMRRAGQDQEIQTSQMRGHGEEEVESLLDTSYMIRSQQEERQYVTSLSFIPHMERHKDVTFICRGVSNQHNKKKTFHCKTIYVKPRLSQPVMRSLCISGKMKYLLNLENFYPKSIRITWRCGVGGSEDVISSTESLADNPDRTYNISSEVRITEDRHKDPGFTVRVTWEHESMESPESRELSIRDSDYRWRPVVEELQIPRLVHGVPTVLQCDISGYFPDAITVTWQRLVEFNIYEEANSAVNQSVTKDNTYSCTAHLTITPTPGEKYICVVNHPALEKPIERSTGRLQVIAAPQMLAPIEITMADSSRVQFTLNLQKFYPKYLKISWSQEYMSRERELSPEQTFTTQDDGLTYDVTSAVRIAEHAFNDPHMRISVVWKHEGMETPETRSLSMRDLPWPPHVGSINIPKLEDGIKTTLTSEISGYFPDLLSVSWLIKKDGNVTARPIEPSKMDRISHKKEKQKDHTYNYEASLSFTPLISADQGPEIICRVEHPSLERPIEKSTGPLHIAKGREVLADSAPVGAQAGGSVVTGGTSSGARIGQQSSSSS
ncbi:uncharacterized protein [Eleutherodactylus coqui]|uniref:uncharacterized protein n=1 Tax=Eleutherodactylus coqui TaxID=57060 RepID=UPI0034625159